VRPSQEARVLAVVLGQEAGFVGSTDEYYHPENSFLHRVVATRRGLPILLSSVWMEVGRRSGILVSGVGLPGHFVVRVGARDGVLVDPFAGGRPLTVEDCRRRVAELSGGSMPWRAEYLRETTILEVLERALSNLSGAFRRVDDDAGRYRAAAFLAALLPDSAQRILERAELAHELGIREAAEKGYSEVVERFPDTNEAQEAAERLEGGGAAPPSLN
jgi:regulator of sirC expression with transglutaminase-like and TPR domain